mmetsp:Transcript_24791/g.59174  ORF Transcript_24791/g.59174 Transcript_24791/m.59174 type:complete len:201 (+) Transcript_24791:1508-2110(+)
MQHDELDEDVLVEYLRGARQAVEEPHRRPPQRRGELLSLGATSPLASHAALEQALHRGAQAAQLRVRLLDAAEQQHDVRAEVAEGPAAETEEEAGEGLEGVALRRRVMLLAQPHATLGEEPPRHGPQPVSGHRGDVRLDPLGVDLETEELGPAGRADVLAAPQRLVRRHHLLPQVRAVTQLVPLLHHASCVPSAFRWLLR